MRRIASSSLLAALLMALAGCGSGGFNPVMQRALNDIHIFDRDKDKAAAPQQQLTRAAVEKSGAALIRGRLLNEQGRTVLIATTRNGPYITYLSPLGQSITLKGTQISGTRGLGFDLLSARSGQDDPLAKATPPARWPTRIWREYQFPGDGPGGTVLRFNCTIERGDANRIEIVEQVHEGIEFSETCTDGTTSFENLHLADARTGFVWRSIQWLGPDQGPIDIEVVEPVD